MDAKQDVTIIHVLVGIEEQLRRIAAALEAANARSEVVSSMWYPITQTATQPHIEYHPTVNGIPTDPYTAYAIGSGCAIRPDSTANGMQMLTADDLTAMASDPEIRKHFDETRDGVAD